MTAADARQVAPEAVALAEARARVKAERIVASRPYARDPELAAAAVASITETLLTADLTTHRRTP